MTNLTVLGTWLSGGQVQSPPFVDFLHALRIREAVAEQAEIRFAYFSYTKGTSTPYMYSSGAALRGGRYEKWTIRDLHQKDLSGPPPWTGLDDLAATLEGLVRPTVVLMDGSRTLSLTPARQDGQLWYGRLSGEVESRHRRGIVNCGLLFNERRLSEYLDGFELAGVDSDPESITYVLQPQRRLESQDHLEVSTLLPDHRLRSIRWMRGDIILIESSCTKYTDFAGHAMVSAGEVVYNNSPSTRITGIMTYVHRILPLEERSLLKVPSELAACKGAAIIKDDLTGQRVLLGDAGPLERHALHARKHSDAAPPNNNKRTSHVVPLMLAIGAVFGILAILCRTYLSRCR